jgi:hypothetical protein
MSPRSTNGGGGAEEDRQAMDDEVFAPGVADRREPVALPPRSRRWYEESTTYQYILEEGEKIGRAKARAELLRRFLLKWGQKRFGTPPAPVTHTLASLRDGDRMERMLDRLMEVSTWQELLDTP